MMKKFFTLTALVLAGAFLLTACAPSAASTDLIYRGEVTSISESGDILVKITAGILEEGGNLRQLPTPRQR